MKTKRLSEKEKQEILNWIKSKKFSNLDNLLLAFNDFIAKRYRNYIRGNHRLSFEDFMSECHLLILNCAKRFEGDSFGELVSLIESTINFRVITMKRDLIKLCKKDLLGDVNDISKFEKNFFLVEFEENILSSMTLESYYDRYGCGKISKYEFDLLKEYINGRDLKIFALNRGVKYESVMWSLRRAKNKVKKISEALNIKSAKEYHVLN